MIKAYIHILSFSCTILFFTSYLAAQKPIVLKWQEKPVIDVEYNNDGTILATLCSDKTISLWNTINYKLIRKLNDKRDGDISIRFNSDGNKIVSGNWDNTVKIWDVDKGNVQKRLVGHNKSVKTVAFHPSGNFVASAGWDNEVRIWYAPTGITLKILKGHTQSIHALDFSPCGKFLVSGGNDLNIKIWDLKTGHEIMNLEGNKYPISDIEYSPDGKFIVSSSYGNNIIIWNTSTGAVDRLLKGHSAGVYAISYSPDGKYLASGGNDKTVKIWDIKTRSCLRTFTGYKHSVKAVDFNPNGKEIATVSSDRSIRVWDVSEFNIGTHFKHSSIYNALLDHDGIFKWTSPNDTTLEYYDRNFTLNAHLLNDVQLKNIKLYINKKEYLEYNGYKKFVKNPLISQSDDQQCSEVEYLVYLYPGNNEIQIYAENNDATKFAFSKPLNITYVDLQEQVDSSDLHVIFLNIPGYNDKKINKDYKTNSFEKIKNIFSNQEGVLYKDIHFYDMTNKDVTTSAQINYTIDNISRKVKKHDYLYLFISGITMKNENGQHYLLPSDFDPKELITTIIDLKYFSKKISYVSGHTCIFYDNTNRVEKYKHLSSSNNTELFEYIDERIINKNNYSLMVLDGSEAGKTFDIITHGFHIENDINKNHAIDIEELYNFTKQLNKVSFISKGRKIPLYYYAPPN